MDGMVTWAKGSRYPAIDVYREALDDAATDPVAAGLAAKSRKTVVVFLSGDGGGDSKGAYIWPDGSKPTGNRDGGLYA